MAGANYIIDTSAWIHYLKGILRDEAKSIIGLGSIGGKNYTPTLVLAELKRAYMRDQISGFDDDIVEIKSKSEIVERIDEETAITAGELKQKLVSIVRGRDRQIGMIDCLILAMAIKLNARVLSSDEHFKRIAFPEEYGIADKVGELKKIVEFIQMPDEV